MDKNNIWFITPQTNLHVGNENISSYDLIDKAVQRDALTGLPCINSSSLKGALNEFATNSVRLSDEVRIKIFGCDKGNVNHITQKGEYTFFDAQILCIPRQSSNTLYELVSCEKIERLFISKAKAFGITITNEELRRAIGYTVLDTNDQFKDLCDNYNLPIIARNRVGDDTNLWYEQVVPSQTVFYTFIANNGSNLLENQFSNNIIQIGANGSIGYGFCKVENLLSIQQPNNQ